MFERLDPINPGMQQSLHQKIPLKTLKEVKKKKKPVQCRLYSSIDSGAITKCGRRYCYASRQLDMAG
jgi:hypothetical protein